MHCVPHFLRGRYKRLYPPSREPCTKFYRMPWPAAEPTRCRSCSTSSSGHPAHRHQMRNEALKRPHILHFPLQRHPRIPQPPSHPRQPASYRLWSRLSARPPPDYPASGLARVAAAFHQQGWLTPVVNRTAMVQGADSPEARAFVVLMQAACRDWAAMDASQTTGGSKNIVRTSSNAGRLRYLMSTGAV